MVHYLNRADVPAHLRQGYDGAKFKAIVCETVTIPTTAGMWESGSRDAYSAINLATGRQISLDMIGGNDPWDRKAPITIELPPNVAIVVHTIFCGKDLGLTFYLRATNAAQLLSAPSIALSPVQRAILIATRSYKASYAGRNRRDMWNADNRAAPIGAEAWNTGKAELVTLGYLNKAGAITVAGRNAIGKE